MKLKVRPTDFKVTERLADDVIQNAGGHRVYRVRKEKLTSLEAATELAALTGVSSGDVGMAGLKDRQGVTVQYMSVERGPSVSVQQSMLGIQTVGYAAARLDSSASIGNEFTLVVRDLDTKETDRVRDSLEAVREHGLPNYFDDQRFGNLRHGQGWIVLDLMRGDVSGALRRLIASSSQYEPPAKRSLKDAIWRSWGHWGACREIAGKLGRHHSVFEHLKRDGDDFIGAFARVGTRERLIHLYAFQSHLWNRALSLWIQNNTKERFGMSALEGKLRFPRWETKIPEAWGGALMLPGERLQGVDDPEQRALYEHVLGEIGVGANELALPDVPGFQLKPEPRDVVVRPRELRVRPAEPDNEYRGAKMLRMSFGLQRGAYATMVIRRLVGPVTHSGGERGGGGGPRDGGGFGGGRRRGSRGRGGGRRGAGGRGGGGGQQGYGYRDSGGQDSGGRDSGGRGSGGWGSGERDSGGRESGGQGGSGRGGARRGGGRGRGARSRRSRRR